VKPYCSKTVMNSVYGYIPFFNCATVGYIILEAYICLVLLIFLLNCWKFGGLAGSDFDVIICFVGLSKLSNIVIYHMCYI